MSARRRSRILSSVFLVFAFSPLATLTALAQQGTPPSTPGSTPSRPTAPVSARPSTPAPRQPERKIIYVSGRVVMDDGNPPSERVAIERVCGGNTRREGYTDSQGRFSIQLGDNREVFQDASTSSLGFGGSMDESLRGPDSRSVTGAMSGVTENELMGCDLRAALSGYRSSHVPLAGRRQFDNPDVGILVLFSPSRQQGTLVSVLSLKAPREARRFFDQGRKAVSRQKWSEAESRFQQAVGQYPKYAEAWFEMGAMYQRQGKQDEARKAYLRAVELDANFVKPLFHLAELSAYDSKWVETARYSRRVLELDPVSFPRVYFLDAVANFNLGDLDKAEKSARRAQMFTPAHQNPRVALLLGSVLMQKHDYKGAVEGFKAYLQHAPDAPDSGEVKAQLQELQKQMGRGTQPEAVAAAPKQP
jgi:cytochrome c-type biogenesis protein CcmH/NrfG